MTQTELAALGGCSVRSVRQAELGLTRVALFEELGRVLGQSVVGRALPAGETLGERLHTLRLRTGKSRRELAILTGVSATTLALIERGSSGNLVPLELVADALGAGLKLAPIGESAFYTGAALSSAWDAWATPQIVLDRLYEVIGGGFDLDPCSPGRLQGRVQARTHFDAADDGLAQTWNGLVYVNPPYGRSIGQWTAKAREEVAAGRASMVVGLLPARTDTSWWHRDIADHAAVWLIKGRLAFGDGASAAPFPSALVLWGGSDIHRERMSTQFPNAWRVGLAPAADADEIDPQSVRPTTGEEP
jgi:phage N-6-adenine-methyltransferase